MAATWLVCLTCKESGAKDPEFDADCVEDGKPTCPACGEQEKLELYEPRFHPAGHIIRGAPVQSAADDWADRRNQAALERDKDKILRGEKTPIIPKHRDKRFDPSWVNEKRLY